MAEMKVGREVNPVHTYPTTSFANNRRIASIEEEKIKATEGQTFNSTQNDGAPSKRIIIFAKTGNDETRNIH